MNIPKSQVMRGCKLTNGYPLVLLNGGSTMMSLIYTLSSWGWWLE
jgi:hypothetical protein